MKISEFSSGCLTERYQYKSFEPNLIDIHWEIDNSDLNYLLSNANFVLGQLNAFSQLIPDIDFYIKMHVLKEGTLSNKIEGTQTNIEDAVQNEIHIEPEKKDDWDEVQNYVNAMNYANERLESLPLSNRLIKETHKILLQGVRGKHKQPGEFRTSQNWIGGVGLNDAVFIPPHNDSINNLMSDLEKFLNNDSIKVPQLIKIGIAHYQFETIHPFLDGNGRIGRLLITLFLVESKLLSKPTLYLSSFFDKYKALYYDNLTKVRTQNDLNRWLFFFLEGVRATSENSIQTFKNIIKIRQITEQKLLSLGKKQRLALRLLKYLYSKPITDASEIATVLSVNISTSIRLLNDFVSLGILIEMTGYKRNKMFKFEEYIALFR